MKPLQPIHLGLLATDAGSESHRFATVGWPTELHPVLHWAEREEVLPALLLILDACHLKPRPAHLGKVLGYLSQEIPMALLRLRAAEFDFIDEVRTLAEAYSADAAIRIAHPPLRIMKSVQSAFPKGQLTELPLLALLSRDISASTEKASKEHLWLEQLRFWCLVEFLKHVRLGHTPPDRLDEVAQKLRQCIDGYPVKREWANLLWELQSPSRTHEELHGHLKSRAAALRTARPGFPDAVSSAHGNLLRDLELIDEPQQKASRQRETSYEFSFATHYGRSAQASALPSFAPISLQASPAMYEEEMNEDDPLPGVRIVLAERSGQIPPPFTAVEFDNDQSPDEQERDKRVVEYLSIEDQQRLPFTWTKPNPKERDLITTWLQKNWSTPALGEQHVAALMYLAAQTARPVRLALQIGICAIAQIDWCLHPDSWDLHRLPPRRAGGAKASANRLEHVQPLASRIVIELPGHLQCQLRDWLQTRPGARSLAELIDPEISLERQVRATLMEIAPRVTPAMLGAWLPQAVFEQTRDPVLTHLLSSNSRTGLPGACAYAAYDNKALAPAVVAQLPSQLRIEPPVDVSTPRNCAGSELRVDEQWLRDQLGNARLRIDTLADDPANWLEYHNALTTYVTLILLATTGGRTINSPFEAVSDLYLDDGEGIAYIEDKVTSTMHAGRLVPLAKRAVRIVRLRYLPWLEQLSTILSHVSGLALPDIKHLGKLKEQSQLPFLFYLTRTNSGELGHLEVSEKTLISIGKWDRLFKPNVFRHRLSTWLKEHGPKGGATHEVINGLLGHNENGTVIWGPYSTRCWAHDAAAFRPLLNRALMSLKPRLPRRFGANPASSEIAKSNWPASHLTEHMFGRQARQARQEVAIETAKKVVENELRAAFEDLRARNALASPVELDRIAQSMLANEKGMPIPRGALRYTAFCEWVRHNWSDPSAKVILRRRYIPQLEEATPFTSSAPHAVALLDAIRGWYVKSNLLTDTGPWPTQSARLAATIGLVLDARVAAPEVLDAVLRGRDGRILKMNERYFFEYSKQLSSDPSLPTLRWAITPRTAMALSLAYVKLVPSSETEAPMKIDASTEHPYQELKRILKLRGMLRPTILSEALAKVVRQANWQQLPGICAAYLEGSITSVALDHSTWHRLFKGTAMRDHAEATTNAFVQSIEEDWMRAITPDAEADLFKRREGARSPEGFTPAVSSSVDISPLAGRSHSKKRKSDTKQQDKKSDVISATVATNGNVTISASASSSHAEVAKAMSQEAARALFLDVHRALDTPGGGQTSRRRQIALALRQAISEHPIASPTCRIYVDWIRSRCWEEVKKDQLLALSSIARYFGALAVCFEQLGYDHDLTRCDEEEVTSFYVDVMNARRQSQASSEEERYKTWSLALSLLKRFHRFAARYYDVNEPDWSEIDGEESTLSISPRLVLEKEYQHALRALVGEAQQAQEGETTHGFMLILAMRFGLRGAEAAKLKQADWLAPAGESRLVLVRNNRQRTLKTLASRRQVPLLFTLTPYENQVIDRHFEKLDANAERGDEKSLFPLLAIDDNDSATKAAKHHISLQLKRSTKNQRVSLHSARHTFANMVTSMLVDMPDAVRQGLFETPPNKARIDHVRALVLSDVGVTRRSPWALARLMGHAHPRTSLRSYVHLLPDITTALVDTLDKSLHTANPQIASEVIVDLDGCPKAPEYLAREERALPLPPLTPTATNALRALRMFKNGELPLRIRSACDLTQVQFEHLTTVLAELDAILARHNTFNTQGRGPSRLLSHIRAQRFEELIDRAAGSGPHMWQPTEGRGLEYLEASKLFGPSRQVVLFSPAQFEFLAFVTKAWNLGKNDFRIIGARDLDPEVEQWAKSHGFSPTRAEDFVYESKRPKARKRTRSTQRQKQFQLDSISVGRPPNPVRHRCAMLCAALSSQPKWNSFELLLIVLVQLYLHQVGNITRQPSAAASPEGSSIQMSWLT